MCSHQEYLKANWGLFLFRSSYFAPLLCHCTAARSSPRHRSHTNSSSRSSMTLACSAPLSKQQSSLDLWHLWSFQLHLTRTSGPRAFTNLVVGYRRSLCILRLASCQEPLREHSCRTHFEKVEWRFYLVHLSCFACNWVFLSTLKAFWPEEGRWRPCLERRSW